MPNVARLPASLARLLAIAGIVTGMPSAGRAEIDVTGPAAASGYRLKVMSWSEIPFRSVVRQQYDFSCGSAAVATLLSYHYNRPTPERQVFTAMWNVGDQAAIRRSGFSMLDIKHYLEAIGYKAAGYRLTGEQLAQLRQPGLVILDLHGYKHFVVVKGVETRGIVVGDPIAGVRIYSPAVFRAVWNGVFLAIAPVAGGDRPGFNLDRDWLPWSRAPLRSSSGRGDIAHLTNSLPPLYQITPRELSLTAAASTP